MSEFAMSEQPSIRSETREGVLVLTLTEPEVRGDTLAEKLRTEMLAALSASGLHRVVVDLGAVNLIATPAFRPLLSLRRKLHEHQESRLVLCGLKPMVAEVFHITRLVSTSGAAAPFETQPDLASAIAAAKQDG
jgi:anti-anti-sigma factor